ncbi:DUF1646 family protein [Litchfieldia salsa]|uniref:Predicted cation transporter n=1 Tax=Litchfieldia salsa TaxID=930152 RepID=A0A1H0WTD0_9BACI|nr:DUF1646 family protein [Litchfieldia salsa]SDP93961.1 Predicted cation transporter [Litchfieldia salsa]
MVISLILIFMLVLILPLVVKKIEQNLEIFLFLTGIVTALISGVLEGSLFIKAAVDPINISLAVLGAGLLFKWFHAPLTKGIVGLSQLIPYRLFIASTVIVLGIISSLITAIIAALVLVLIVTSLQLHRKSMVRLVVISCFSIGMGAALTPLGEPLSTIAISKLDEDFFFLLDLLGSEIIFGIVMLGGLASVLIKKSKPIENLENKKKNSENYEEILLRALKIYFFVMGLTFLGSGFEPLINKYFIGLNPMSLYWLNMISAVLDNATLTAAEISSVMNQMTIKAILLGLLVSGGMLIPGNIPNIIAAGKLQITSKEWAVFAFPLGLFTMIIYFIILFFV